METMGPKEAWIRLDTQVVGQRFLRCVRTVPKLDLLSPLGLLFERKADSPSCCKY